MRSKFFVIGTAVVALAFAAGIALVNANQDIANKPVNGRVLGITSFQGILQSREAGANGNVALVLLISYGNNKQSTVTVNTLPATKFIDKNGAIITVPALAPAHALEVTGTQEKSGFVATLVKDQSYALARERVTVSKNTALDDGTIAVPTGRLGVKQVKVASFLVTTPRSDDARIVSIVLRDASGICATHYVSNIILRDSLSQILSLATPAGGCGAYALTFNPALVVRANTNSIVDVLADLNALTTVPLPLFTVEKVNAVSAVSGNDMSAQNVGLPLQADYIAGAGTLSVQTDSDTPVATNYLMGSADQTIAQFKLTAGQNEAVDLKQLIVSFLVTGQDASAAVKNIRLFDVTNPESEVQIGSTVSALGESSATVSSTLADYQQALFASTTFAIPAGTSKTLAVKVDFTSYLDGHFTSSGQTITPVILSAVGSVNSLEAVGASSGDTITPAVINSGVPGGDSPGSYASTAALYRAKLSVSWIPDSPEGFSSPNARQVVGKIMITNLANAGLYGAQLKYLNPELLATFSSAADQRYLTVFKDDLTTSALGQVNWSAPAGVPELAGFTDDTMTNVDINAGASKTFFITLDTTNAIANGSLSIRLPAGSIHWSDGTIDDITAMGNDLPLLYRTMTY